MRKEKKTLDDIKIFEDYKAEYIWERSRLDIESTEIWLYLAADAANDTFAKVGLTMGDLSSRSYSSGNPRYYLFCAFKCKHDLQESKLKSIEDDLLSKLEDRYRYDDGSTKRERFHESGRKSECFYDIDFLEFFKDIHFELYENHRSSFVISGMSDGFGSTDGEFVDCIFNSKVSDPHHYRRMIIQY